MDFDKQNDIFEEAKMHASGEHLLKQYGIQFEREGKTLKSQCPLPGHDDSDPSFKWYKENSPERFKCFGCHKSGTALDLVMFLENIDIVQAAYKLSEYFNFDIAIKPEDKDKIRNSRHKLQVLNAFTDECHRYLIDNKDKEPMNILYKHLLSSRHINEKVIEKAKIGWGGFYRDGKTNKIISRVVNNYGNITLDDLEDAGLIVNKQGPPHSKFCGYYTMPFLDNLNNTKWLTGRIFEGKDFSPEYINEPPKYRQMSSNNNYADKNQLYNENYASEMLMDRDYKQNLFVVEGQFDALALAAEDRPAVALSGTNVGKEQINKVIEFYNKHEESIDEVSIAFDREDTYNLGSDEKAIKSAFKLSKELIIENVNNRVVEIPKNIKKYHSDYIKEKSKQREVKSEIDIEELLEEEFEIEKSGEKKIIKGIDVLNSAVEDSSRLIDRYIKEIKTEDDKVTVANKVEEVLEIICSLDDLIKDQYLNELNQNIDRFDKRTLKRKMKNIEQNKKDREYVDTNKIDLSDIILDIEQRNNDKGEAAQKITKTIVNRLQNYGRNKHAKNIFFHSKDFNKTYLLFDGDFIEINGSNNKFKAMLSKFAGGVLNTTKNRGKSVTEELTSYAVNNGEPIDDISWSKTVMDTDKSGLAEDIRIYFPLANKHNELVKIGDENKGVEVTPNAVNKDNAIIRMPSHMEEWEYKEDVDIEDAMSTVKKAIWDNLAVEPELKLFVIASMFTLPMIGTMGNIAHIRFQGSSNTGKSQIGKILTTAMLGEDRVSDLTNAAMRSLLENSPLVCLDEFESDDFSNNRMKLIRIAVSGGEYNKMSKQNEREVITQRLRAMIYTAGIDRLESLENINRTFVVKPKEKFYAEEFDINRIKRKIKKFRNEIMSAMVNITHDKIIPEYEIDENGNSTFYEIKRNLDNNWSDHPLNRLFGYLSLVAMYAKEISRYMPKIKSDNVFGVYDSVPNRGSKRYINGIISRWLDIQGEIAWKSMEVNSTYISDFENIKEKFENAKEQIKNNYGDIGSRNEYQTASEYLKAEYNLDVKFEKGDKNSGGEIIISGTTDSIFKASSKIRREDNNEVQIHKAGKYATRLCNDVEVIRKRGWRIYLKNNGSREKVTKHTDAIDLMNRDLEIRKKV